MSMKKAYITIHGRVQGIGFRFFVSQHARALHLNGIVQNNSDGTVSVDVEGEQQSIKELIALLHQGPSMSNVTEVDTEWNEYRGDYKDFRIIG